MQFPKEDKFFLITPEELCELVNSSTQPASARKIQNLVFTRNARLSIYYGGSEQEQEQRRKEYEAQRKKNVTAASASASATKELSEKKDQEQIQKAKEEELRQLYKEEEEYKEKQLAIVQKGTSLLLRVTTFCLLNENFYSHSPFKMNFATRLQKLCAVLSALCGESSNSNNKNKNNSGVNIFLLQDVQPALLHAAFDILRRANFDILLSDSSSHDCVAICYRKDLFRPIGNPRLFPFPLSSSSSSHQNQSSGKVAMIQRFRDIAETHLLFDVVCAQLPLLPPASTSFSSPVAASSSSSSSSSLTASASSSPSRKLEVDKNEEEEEESKEERQEEQRDRKEEEHQRQEEQISSSSSSSSSISAASSPSPRSNLKQRDLLFQLLSFASTSTHEAEQIPTIVGGNFELDANLDLAMSSNALTNWRDATADDVKFTSINGKGDPRKIDYLLYYPGEKECLRKRGKEELLQQQQGGGGGGELNKMKREMFALLPPDHRMLLQLNSKSPLHPHCFCSDHAAVTTELILYAS